MDTLSNTAFDRGETFMLRPSDSQSGHIASAIASYHKLQSADSNFMNRKRVMFTNDHPQEHYYEETKVATTSSKALNTPLQALGANRAIEKQFSELHNFLVESGVALQEHEPISIINATHALILQVESSAKRFEQRLHAVQARLGRHDDLPSIIRPARIEDKKPQFVGSAVVDGLYSIIHCCENFAAYLGIPTKDCSASNRDEQLSLLDFLDEENRISLQKCLNLHNVVGSQTEVASPQPMYLPVSIRALELHERSGRKRKRRSYYFRISSTSSTASSSPSSSPQSIMEEGESEGLLLGTSTTANTAAGSPCFEVQIVCA